MPGTRPLSLPLSRKLPLLVCGLLVGVTVLQTVASYGDVRASGEAVARERLRAVTTQLAGMLATSATNSVTTLQREAGDSAYSRFLRAPTSANRAAALAVMRKPRPGASQRIVTELWSAQQDLLLSTAREMPVVAIAPRKPREIAEPGGARNLRNAPIARNARTAGDGRDASEEIAAVAKGGRPAIGRFRYVRDSVMVPVVAAVGDPHKPAGYLVVWSRIAATPAAREPLLRLIGSGSSLYVGNDTGSFWTDLSGSVPAPAVDPRRGPDVVVFAGADGEPVLGRARAIAGTPWYVLIEFPESIALAGTQRFLWRAALVGLALLAAGFILTVAMTRSITKPLDQLSAASHAIAAGNFTATVPVERHDELGALGEAFNTMASQVRDTHSALEERVRDRTKALEERNEELEAYAYSVSHDLRSPIRAMHGFATAIIEDFGDALGDEGRDYAARIASAAVRMDALVVNLLEYSQIARGDVTLEPVDLGVVVKGAIAGDEADIRSKRASVTVDGPLPIVMGHGPILSRVVGNLLGNALKFVALGQAPHVRIATDGRDGWSRLWVEDNGVGIAAEQHELIFRVFERLQRREDYPGTGIGLAIVRKGIERMGGRSGVESAPGRGSRFWFELRTAENET